MLDILRAIEPVEQMEPIPTRYVSTVTARRDPWEEDATLRSLGVTLPPDLRAFWGEIESARLFVDENYGQWGLVLWSPQEAAAKTATLRKQRPGDLLPADLAIGEFLGDADVLLVRSDPASSDFGAVVVALPIDRRGSWPVIAPSFRAFIERWVGSGGKKDWPH